MIAIPLGKDGNRRACLALDAVVAGFVAMAPGVCSGQTSWPLDAAPYGGVERQQAQNLHAMRGGFGEASEYARVVGGKPTSKGEWRSLVYVEARIAPDRAASCGGTVIAERWVLTAGHCVVGKSAADFTITEGADMLTAGGHKMRVDRVVLHEDYASGPPRNDIALLHLATSAQSPGQPLIGDVAARNLLHAGATTTLAGFGLTTPQPVSGAHTGTLSDVLREVDLPVVERAECAKILSKVFGITGNVNFLGESTVCAGDPGNGGRDACFGASGGPLTLDVDRRRIQIGVVSWGPGCGLRDTVGIYTSVGYFQDWIRRYVPDATFMATGDASPPAPPSVANICNLPPVREPNARVMVDIVEGSRLRIGTEIHIRNITRVAGQLMVLNIDTQTCRTYQVFPNGFSAAAVLASGTTVLIPAADEFAIRVGAPAGRNRLYALIIPPGVAIRDLAARGADMRTFDNAASLWRELNARTQASGLPSTDAVGVFEYEIVP
jgi:hypothetical protein